MMATPVNLRGEKIGEPNWKNAPMARRVKAIFTQEVPAAGLVEYYITVADGSNSIRWKATTGAFWYRIYRGNKPDFKPGPENFVTYVTASMLSFIDGAPGFDGKPLSGNQFYRITAVDKTGNESVASESVNIAARMH